MINIKITCEGHSVISTNTVRLHIKRWNERNKVIKKGNLETARNCNVFIIKIFIKNLNFHIIEYLNRILPLSICNTVCFIKATP